MNKYIKPILLLTLTLVMVAFIYQPALNGGFIFDDFNNLYLLANMQGEFSLEHLQTYLASQKSGPVGRPISAMSFLLDGMNWPVASERPFKVTNLIIHLVNTALLFVLMIKLFGLFDGVRRDRYWLAFIACTLWAAHPFFVSTTMYVVQRMAMLPATFTLLGMLAYLRGRMILQTKPIEAVLMMILGVWGCTLLAILSKENGVLLLVHIWLFEFLLLRKQLNTTLPKKINLVLIVIPVFLLISAMIYKFSDHTNYYDARSFDMYERLLTQSKMIFKYLYYLWVPDYLTEGVFNDGIVVSKGIFQPISTLFSVVGVVLLLIVAWVVRNKLPLLSFAVLFYFIGHAMESTYIPLELYFEHRNYLPAMFMFLPVSLFVYKLRNQPKLYITIPCILILFVGFLTYLRANVWGNNLMLHYETSQKYPESARAANMTASLFAWEGQYDKALEMLEYGISNDPKIQLRLNKVAVLCELNKVKQSDLDNILFDIKKTDLIKDDLTAYRDFLSNLISKECYENYGKSYAQKFLDAFENNNFFKTSQTARKYFYYQNATIQAKLLKLEKSLASFKKIITEVDGISEDPIFESSALTAIDYLYQLDARKSIELATYYKNYCLQNFSDCDTIFVNQLDKKINDAAKDIPDYSGQE